MRGLRAPWPKRLRTRARRRLPPRPRLLNRNLQPISILEKRSLLQFEITRKKVSKRELMHLCRQLAVFLRAGISVTRAGTAPSMPMLAEVEALLAETG